MSGIKRCCWKNDNVEDEKVVFVYENIGIKDDRDNVTRKKKFAKRKIGFEIRNGFLSFIVPQGLLCTH